MNETAVNEAAGGTAILRARGLRKYYGPARAGARRPAAGILQAETA
jgi:hypothetical protein